MLRSAYVAKVDKKNCAACGKCVEFCPAHIAIQGYLRLAKEALTENGKVVGVVFKKCISVFNAFHLHRDLPGCSVMTPSEDKLKHIFSNMIKQSLKIKFAKKEK